LQAIPAYYSQRTFARKMPPFHHLNYISQNHKPLSTSRLLQSKIQHSKLVKNVPKTHQNSAEKSHSAAQKMYSRAFPFFIGQPSDMAITTAI
jgi:hypothetical protein